MLPVRALHAFETKKEKGLTLEAQWHQTTISV